MSDPTICPTCHKPVAGMEAPKEGPLCSPLQSPDCWRVVGKATTPHPLTGNRNMLTVIDGGTTSEPSRGRGE